MRILLKYGGNAMQGLAGDPLLAELVKIHREGGEVVIVHGGGPQIDEGLAEIGHVPARHAGLRVTDARAMTVVERTLCGTVNKAMVRALEAAGAAAVGYSGMDGGTLIARKLQRSDGADLGFVGEIVRCDVRVTLAIMRAGFVPVIAPVAAGDGGLIFNVNADTAAGSLAGALDVDACVIVTDVASVRRHPKDPGSAIRSMSLQEAEALNHSGAFEGGMGPKVEAALTALHAGARRVLICNATGGIKAALAGQHGTEVTL